MSNKPPAVRLATALFTAVWVLGAVKLVRSLKIGARTRPGKYAIGHKASDH